MHKFLRLFLIITCFLFLKPPSTAFASSNFKTDYRAVYTVHESGITHVDLNIALTNNSADFYASSYKMQFGFNNITNIKASDSLGPTTVVLDKTTDGNNVLLTFDKKAVGLGKKLPITLSFDTNNVAKNSGNIWEINIPGIANPDEFTTFTAEVKTPAFFGKPTIIKPAQQSNNLIFNKDQLGKSGISIAFGDTQNYDFNLVYHIKNSNLYPIKTEIAIPTDTNYQKVSIDNIDPRPENVILDKDGNWLAQYSLSPTQKKDIKVKGIVEINLNPLPSAITDEEKSTYTANTNYWPSNDPQIKKLATQLKTPEMIYQYVVKTLKYDFSRVTDDKARLGGVKVLSNPKSAVCREFTDLFISLARAAHIPAREVDGFANTKNDRERPLSLVQDILHAWPEYYDSNKKTWIMVDPTWGNTTGGIDYFNILDFDHFAFAIKGASDNYPVPAGGYKAQNGKNVKDVNVTFSKKTIAKTNSVDIQFLSSRQIAGFPIQAKVKLINKGATAITQKILHITSSDLKPNEQAMEISQIPPYGSIVVDVKFDKTDFLTNKDVSFTMRFIDTKKSQTLKSVPFYQEFKGIGGIIAIGLFTITLLIIAGKDRGLSIFR